MSEKLDNSVERKDPSYLQTRHTSTAAILKRKIGLTAEICYCKNQLAREIASLFYMLVAKWGS
jgi:hypothetical protein